MHKTDLSPAKLKESLQELARLGSPVDLSVANGVEREKVEIEQVGGVHDSKMFELEDGRIGLMADITVTNQTSRAIHVVDVQLRTGCGDCGWDWLTPRRINTQGGAKWDCGYSAYQFPGRCGLQLECGQVINHFLLEGRSLPSRHPLGGFLLAIGGFMPADLRHGQWLTPTLAVIGSDHREYATTMHLWTERLEVRPKVVKPRTSLFAQPGAEERLVTGSARWPTSQTIPSPPPGDTPDLEELY